jgi:hypothetical protein
MAADSSAVQQIVIRNAEEYVRKSGANDGQNGQTALSGFTELDFSMTVGFHNTSGRGLSRRDDRDTD